MKDLPEWMPPYFQLASLSVLVGGSVQPTFYKTGLRAQIAVLEEEVEELNGFSWAQLKIAALRKEIEQ